MPRNGCSPLHWSESQFKKKQQQKNKKQTYVNLFSWIFLVIPCTHEPQKRMFRALKVETRKPRKH